MEEDLTIEVDDELYEFLRKRAEAKGISVDDEAREILIASVHGKPDDGTTKREGES